MTVRENVRKHQDKELSQLGASEELRTLSEDLYDKLDALTGSQRLLAARVMLAEVHQVLSGETTNDPAMLFYANALTAVAGYAVEAVREENGDTATADTKVTDVLNKVRALVRQTALDAMSPAQRAMAQEMTDRVSHRVNDLGEDFDAVYAEEVGKLLQEHSENHVQPPTLKVEQEDTGGYGMYL